MRRLALAAARLVQRRPLLLAWLILLAVLAAGVVEVHGQAAPPAAASPADCRTAASEADRIAAMPGHALVRILAPGEVARANAWLAAAGSDEADFTLGVLFARADGAAVLALGRAGCVDRWVLISPLEAGAFVAAVDGTAI